MHNAILGMRFSCKSSPSIRNFAHFLFLLKPVSCLKITSKLSVNIIIEIISRPKLGQDILGLQPRDKAAMLVVNTTELFHEQFT